MVPPLIFKGFYSPAKGEGGEGSFSQHTDKWVIGTLYIVLILPPPVQSASNRHRQPLICPKQ
jgi:hypothetical protein